MTEYEWNNPASVPAPALDVVQPQPAEIKEDDAVKFRDFFSKAADIMVNASKLSQEVALMREQMAHDQSENTRKIETLQRELEEVRGHNAVLNDSLNTAVREKGEVTAALKQREQEWGNARVELENTIASLRYELGQAKEQGSQWQESYNSLRTAQDQLFNEHVSVTDERDTLKHQLGELTAKHEEVQRKVQGLMHSFLPQPSTVIVAEHQEAAQ